MSDINNIFKEVISNSNIIDVVSHYLGAGSVKKQGKNYVCLCPFHNDNHPSMSLDSTRNIFHCWSCNEKGGPIEFITKYKKVSKMDALKELASISNISLPDNINLSQNITSKEKFKNELNALNDLAAFYQLMLSSKFGKQARDYLESRKIDEESIKHFMIGYAPIDSKKTIEALEKNYSLPVLEKSGILSTSKSLEDRMFNRIIFPLKDEFGNIVAFSGRQIEKSDTAKYINYPDTPLFVKGNLLYNYSEAKIEAKKVNYLYLVEGYMDAIAYYRSEIKSVVALMGTALNKNQIKLIKNLNVEVRLSLDNDIPGQTNQIRIMNQLLSENIKVLCVRPFTKFKDADEVYFNGGKKLLTELSSKLIDPFLFFFAFTLHGRKELNDTNELNKFVTESKAYFTRLDEVSKIKNLEILSKISKIEIDELQRLYYQKSDVRGSFIDENHYFNAKKRVSNSNESIKKRIDKIYNPSTIDSARLAIKSFVENSQFESFNIQEIIYYGEVELITNCLYSIKAVDLISEKKYVFAFPPFNDMYYLISFVYQNNPGLDSFNKELFNQLLDSFYSNGTESGDMFEGIELSDITFAKEISKNNYNYLKDYIELFLPFAISNSSEFNINNFTKSIERLSKIKRKNNFKS